MKAMPLIPLAMVTNGETVRVVSVEGGQGIRKRLADLGLNIGETLSVIQAGQHGPMLLAVKESRLAIGRGVAHKILVELSPAGCQSEVNNLACNIHEGAIQ